MLVHYTSKMVQTNVLATVMQTGLVTPQQKVNIWLRFYAQWFLKQQKQKCAALSTAKAEYVALCGAARESLWLRQPEKELECSSDGPKSIHEDNQSAITMTNNPQFHGQAKH